MTLDQSYTDPRKGTGRTTRAVKFAIQLAKQEETVFFLCHEAAHDVIKPILCGEAMFIDHERVFFFKHGGHLELLDFRPWNDSSIREEALLNQEIERAKANGILIIDHAFAQEYNCKETRQSVHPFIHAFDHDNREIPALTDVATARKWVCDIAEEFSWRAELGADLALLALKKATDPLVRMVLLGAVDSWTRKNGDSA